MKKALCLILALVMALSLSASAFAANMNEDKPTYVTVYGLNQPYTDRIWAVSSQGYVSLIQVWDGGTCISGNEGNHIMLPNHDYRIVVRVVGVTGDIYINGTSCWAVKSYGDYGTADRFVTGKTTFSTPEYFCPLWGFWGFPCWGWR